MNLSFLLKRNQTNESHVENMERSDVDEIVVVKLYHLKYYLFWRVPSMDSECKNYQMGMKQMTSLGLMKVESSIAIDLARKGSNIERVEVKNDERNLSVDIELLALRCWPSETTEDCMKGSHQI
jgi:hypothetical protein